MKRLFICIIFFSFLNSYSHASSNRKHESKKTEKLHFGATAGINYSNIILTNTNAKLSFLLGWNVGAYCTASISERLSFQPEILYTLKGATTPFIGANIYSHRECVEIPLQLKIKPFNHFIVMCGPYVCYLLGLSSNFYDYFPKAGIAPYLGSYWDIGATVSLGYERENGFNVGIRIERGFNNVNIPDNLIKEYDEVGTIYLGWTFIKYK